MDYELVKCADFLGEAWRLLKEDLRGSRLQEKHRLAETCSPLKTETGEYPWGGRIMRVDKVAKELQRLRTIAVILYRISTRECASWSAATTSVHQNKILRSFIN